MATWRPITLTLTDDLGPLPPHADRARPRRGLRLLERLLLLLGIVGLGYYGYVTAETALYQAYETRELDAILTSATHARETPATPAAPARGDARAGPRSETTVILRPRPAAGSPLGLLVIPRLGVSAIVRVGSDSRTLQLAIGHIGGTALPGERGNMGLAAHRDTFFRRLGEIQPDDQVQMVTVDGIFDYRVEGTRIVEPRDTWVLDPTAEPTLTLVTCYPFRYVGSAPQRFIVRARLANH